MTSFGDEPTGAAVDGATVKLKTITFAPPANFSANVLVIDAEIGVEAGHLHRMAYQVTVLAQPDDSNKLLPDPIPVTPDQVAPQ
jgi:hypothetical protein